MRFSCRVCNGFLINVPGGLACGRCDRLIEIQDREEPVEKTA